MKVVDAPALDHDAYMVKHFGTSVGVNGKLERKIVANLINHLNEKGFKVLGTYDGDVYERCSTAKEAMEFIFNLDEVSLRVRGNGGSEHGILLIVGEGETMITDWNYSEGDADGFDAAMNEFNVEDCI